MEIPPYNTKPVRELYYENAYHFSDGRICRKGEKYIQSFKVNIIPENLVVEKGKYTYHHAAMQKAANWIESNKEYIFIEWWGPDSNDMEAINNILVRFRDYQPVLWNEEKKLLAHIKKNGTAAQQKFVGKQFGNIGRFVKTEEYIPVTRWEKFLDSFVKIFAPKRATYIYEDVWYNWNKHQEAIAEMMIEDEEELKRLGQS